MWLFLAVKTGQSSSGDRCRQQRCAGARETRGPRSTPGFCLDPQAQRRAQRAGQVGRSRLKVDPEAAIRDGQGRDDADEDCNRSWRRQALGHGRRSGGRATQFVACAAPGTGCDLRTRSAGTTRLATGRGSNRVTGRCQHGRSQPPDEQPDGRQRCEQTSHRPRILRVHLLSRKQNAQPRSERTSQHRTQLRNGL